MIALGLHWIIDDSGLVYKHMYSHFILTSICVLGLELKHQRGTLHACDVTYCSGYGHKNVNMNLQRTCICYNVFFCMLDSVTLCTNESALVFDHASHCACHCHCVHGIVPACGKVQGGSKY